MIFDMLVLIKKDFEIPEVGLSKGNLLNMKDCSIIHSLWKNLL